jgi:glutathione S-transferase
MIASDALHALSAGRPPMVLRTTLTSPYGRKVRMAAEVLDLSDSLRIVPADTLDPEDDLRDQNPLGKMPCLIVGDEVLFDSRVILDFLDSLAGGGHLAPPSGMERFRALTRAALADGIADAGLLMVYERRFRDPAQVSQRWLEHQASKIQRAMAAFARDLPDPARTDAVSISLACALGYLDWRQPLDWRADYPGLARWLADFAAAEPAFATTESPT